MGVFLVFKPIQAQIDSIVLDASITEAHEAEVDVTMHPVEQGADIADHARPKPVTLTLEGLITNTPLVTSDVAKKLQGAQTSAQFQGILASDADAGQTSDLSTQNSFQPSRAGQAYQDLLRLKDAGQVVDIVTALRTYENMVITSLSVPRSAASGQALRFTCKLTEVILVESKLAPVQVDKGQGKKDLGKRATTNTPAATSKTAAKFLEDKFVPGAATNLVKGAALLFGN